MATTQSNDDNDTADSNNDVEASTISKLMQKGTMNGSHNNNNNNYYASINSIQEKDQDRTNNVEEDEVTYVNLILRYSSFRIFLCSFIITYIGEWLTYIASLSLIEHILLNNQQNNDNDDNTTNNNRTAISILVVVRFLPFFLISPFGGVLADGRDRRHSMIFLDLVGGSLVLLFVVAKYLQSIPLIYVITFLQWTVAGLYEPCRSSIIPMMVPEEAFLKKAMTLSGILWSTLAAIGSATGGLLVAYVGFDGCFVIDSMTYMASAFFIWLIGGHWNVDNDDTTKKPHKSLWDKIKDMSVDGTLYITSSFWGALVLLKASGAIVWGALDVLNVSFAEEDENEASASSSSSERLGYLFAFTGIGCLIGPILADEYTTMEIPSTLQRVCVWGLVWVTLGCMAMGVFQPFWSLLLFTMIRSMGSSVVWVYSSLLLQKFSSIEMLGRVSAMDNAFALLAQSLAAYVLGGYFQDNLGYSAREISTYILGGMGIVVTVFWTVYHVSGKGAADIHQVQLHHDNKKQKEEEEQKRLKEDDEESDLAPSTNGTTTETTLLIQNGSG